MFNNQTWIKHEVEAMAPDSNVQDCIHCKHHITDYRNVSFMSSNNQRGYPAGVVYQLPGSGITTAIEPERARRILSCKDYFSARIEKAEDVNCNPDMKASHQTVNP